MSSTTIGTATDARPTNEAPPAVLSNTAERRVRALAPTVFCPESTVDECVQQLQVGRT